MTDPRALTEEDMISRNVRMGQLIDVELVNVHQDRCKCRLIGVRDGRYLILEQPDIRQYGLLREQIVENQALIIRTICEKTTGECLGFRSAVLGSVDFPFRLFFISFPVEIETHELRTEHRQDIRRKALIYTSEKSACIDGEVIDISKGGCRFEFPVSDSVMSIKTEKMFIEIEDPDGGGLIKHQALVCSQRKEANRISLGLSFL